jgi:hypothetical protein
VPNKDCKQYKLNEDNELVSLGKKCPHVNNFYDASLSTSSSDVTPSQFPCQASKGGVCEFELAYGDGSFILGDLVQDEFSLAGLSTKVVFGQAWAESQNFGAGTDGIMGLAYQALDPHNGDSVFGEG